MITNIAIEISNKCNLNCLHCYYAEKSNDTDMALEDFCLILNKFKHLEKVIISGGEPLMNLQIVDILNECIKHDHIQFTITTNGTLFNERIINCYKESSNIHFQISLEGSHEELNDIIRGEGTFKQVIANVQKLASIDSNRLKLRMTVNGLNYSDCEKFYTFSKHYNIVPEYMFVTRVGNAKDNWNVLQMNSKEKLYVYSKIAKLYRLDNLDMASPSEVQECSLCDSYTITTQGNIYICSYFPNDFIGNVFLQTEESIEENYYNHEIFGNISKWKKDVFEKVCGNCAIKSKCGQGCFGRYICNNFDNPGRLDDGCCEFRKLRFLYNHLDHI